jgi:hypothetical protein
MIVAENYSNFLRFDFMNHSHAARNAGIDAGHDRPGDNTTMNSG